MKDVVVLGSGPAGTFAALAALDAGARVSVFGLGETYMRPNSGAAGVFLLADDIGLPLRSAQVSIIGRGGMPCDYSTKVYADPDMPNSFGVGRRWQRYYDGAQALDMAWDIVHSAATYERKDANVLDAIEFAKHCDLVVNTIPLDALMGGGVKLPCVPAWVYKGEAPVDEAYMLYHANETVPWYRASAAFGRFTLEYAHKPLMLGPGFSPYTHLRKVMPSPIADKFKASAPANVLFTGRFGAWDKRKLSHHAYTDTLSALGGNRGV